MVRIDENGYIHTGDADISDIVHLLKLDVFDTFDDIPLKRHIEDSEFDLVQEFKRKRQSFYNKIIKGEY
ncbi:MAG: hypothetical protein IKW81_07385 [Pseudobutyrivibrio sp.]|nr:hypothetical protein [Pseudobutyrivibrio sp.]